MKIIICTRCGDDVRADRVYALYQLKNDGTKVWRTDLCSDCDISIDHSNAQIKKYYNEFVEVEA